jgi:hypothetical protein
MTLTPNYQATDVELQCGVVVGPGFIEVDEEEEVGPLVVFVLHVVLEALEDTLRRQCVDDIDRLFTPPWCSKSYELRLQMKQVECMLESTCHWSH